jgi:hypothetical protein
MRELWGALVVALVVACGGGRDVPTEGRGTAACRLWQDSVCDWAVRCEASTRDVCDEHFQGVTCRSDEAANQCSHDIDSASCRTVPPQCAPDAIADPAPAVKACAALTSAVCKHDVTCGYSPSEEECLARESVDCSRSIAFTLDYEACIDEVENLGCDTRGRPDVCVSVIVGRSPAPPQP